MNKTVTLPQDVILLICQALGARRDFTTLYRCTMLSKRIVNIALEQLYGNLQVMDPFIEDKFQAARLWRSIILSSFDLTSYPYCSYLRVLSLGSLIEFLNDVRNDQYICNFFFGGLMEDLLDPRLDFQPFDYQETARKCGDCITKYIQMLAEISGTTMALTHLESNINLTRDNLSTWLSRVPTLTSLQLEDGSTLDAEVGRTIARCCPKFSELICFHFTRPTSAIWMADFFEALRPNSLRRFEVHSINHFGNVTVAALGHHAESLKVLNLRSLHLENSPVMYGNEYPLARCTRIESLLIEKDDEPLGLNEQLDPPATHLAQWISSCKSLRELSLIHVREALVVLKQLLQTPDIYLEQLVIQDFSSASDQDEMIVWNALGRQTQLKLLTIASQDSIPDGLSLSSHPELTNAICRLTNLTSLNLMQASVTTSDIQHFSTKLLQLEELSFGGDLIDAQALDHLCKLPKLVSLSINAITVFTFDDLRSFAQRLDPVTNRGIRVDLLNQWFESKLTNTQVLWLSSFFVGKLNGRISISYPNDPDEFHESDFSSSVSGS